MTTLGQLAQWLQERSRLARVRAVLAGSEPTAAVWSTAERLGVSVLLAGGGPTAGSAEEGRAVADAEADAGTDLLVVAGVDTQAVVPALVVVAALAGLEPVAVVASSASTSTGGRLDDAHWMTTVTAVRDGLRAARKAGDDPVDVLAAVGRSDLAFLSGLLGQAALRRTPVVLDGVVAGAAALATDRMSPEAAPWWIAGHDDGEPASRAALAVLGLEPLLALGAPAGLGGLLAVPLLQAAVELGG